MKKRVIYILVSIEIIILIWIFLFVYKRFIASRPIPSVIPMRKEALRMSEFSGLKFFYEPDPAFAGNPTENPSWLTSRPQYQINKDTLNDRYDYAEVKPPHTYRILTLGDSYTFGLYVDTALNYPETLEDMLNNNLRCTNIQKFEIINLGMYGYDIQYSAARFALRGTKYNPDLVVWLMLEGNFLKSQELINLKIQEDPQDHLDADSARKALLSELGEDNIIAIHISAISSFFQTHKGSTLFYAPLGSMSTKIKQLVEQLQLSKERSTWQEGTVDINQKQKTAFPDGHPNEAGYQKIASDIFSKLTTIIPCNK